MANNHRYGIRFVRSISGGGDCPQTFTFPIASAYQPNPAFGTSDASNCNLNIGDPVALAADGTLKLTQAGQDVTTTNTDPADYAFGVIVGFPRVIVGGSPRPGSFYTGGTTYTGGIGSDSAPLATVIPVAGNIFEIDANAIVGAATKSACLGVVGNTATIAYSVLATGIGQPKANPLLNVSTLIATGLIQQQLQIIGLGKAGDSMDFTASNVTFQVMFTAQELAVGTAASSATGQYGALVT
jgi:hypothetical protein